MEANEPAILKVIVPLRQAGFALQWLHPKSKRPIGAEWQKAPVATIDDLRASYVDGNNLSVRLGEPSALTSGGYLHVIDADIRVIESAEEAWAKLDEMFPAIRDSLPTVKSGSGGESRHFYFVTDKPFWGKKLAVSEGKHRRYDKDRGKHVWSYDWEIELFGTNRHVAMPPSIHPDTGQPYVWLREFPVDLLALGLAPTISSDVLEALAVAETATYEFETREPLTFEPGQLERDLDDIPLGRLDDYHDWVTLGQALHHQFGAGDDGFALWVEHSKRSEKFDGNLRTMRSKWRSFGRNRRQPVTMGSVRQWAIDARRDRLIDAFDEVDDEPAAVTDPVSGLADMLGFDPDDDDETDDIDAIDGAPVATKPELEWMSLLATTADGKGWANHLHNVELIVTHDPRLAGIPQLNEFTQETVQRSTPGRKAPRRPNAAKPTRQLEGRVWSVRDTINGDLWSDDRDFAIRSILEAPKSQGGYGIQITDRNLKAAVTLAANACPFHPVREYLDGLTWDGAERVETLFIRYFGATDDSYTRSVARLMMVGAVTRIFEPGSKFDFAVILEGLQGKRKSTFIAVLAKHWFAELDGDFHDPRAMVELMQGAWILELPELTGFQRSDVRAIKAFISRQRDRARLAYARRAGEFPRQCIFIGSTNDREYLKDDTGGRRFWPMPCTVDEIDTDALAAEVDHLWAEAVHLYREMRIAQPHGTLPLYLRDEGARITAARLQESRRVESADDALAGQIAAWLDRPISDGGFDDTDVGGAPRFRSETCLIEVWVECMGKDKGHYNQQVAQTIGRAMKLLAPVWVTEGSFYPHPHFGRQRVYRRGGNLSQLLG